MRMLSADWEAMFPPPGNPTPTNTTTLKRWLYWAYVHSVSPPTPPSHLYYLFFFFFFAPYWPNHSQTIFQTAAFVSKQLYLPGYGLFSLALSILCYRLSLSFGSKPYGT